MSTKTIIRQLNQQLEKVKEMTADSELDSVISWFDRTNSIDLIKSAMNHRFSYGITKDDAGYQTYRRGAVAAEIDNGLIEVVSTGIGSRIAESLANLFTRQDQHWGWSDSNGEQLVEAEELIKKHRDNGGFYQTLVSADRTACAVESCAVRLVWRGGKLQYEYVPPQNIKIMYGNLVNDNGEMRYVDQLDIDDASAVVVRLSGKPGQSDEGLYNSCRWVAYIGKCEQYPNGRCVMYVANADKWENIPRPGTVGSVDVMRDDEPCNPLTYLSNTTEYNGSEYPVVILRGGMVSATNSIMPTTTTLFETTVELELAWSRLVKAALSDATGREVLKNPLGSPLPEVTEGLIVLREGQEYEIKNSDSGSVTTALGVVKEMCAQISSGWHVPAFMIVDRQGTEPQSGIALAIQSSPLLSHSDFRDKINKSSVIRMCLLEQGLINYHSDEEVIPWGAAPTWNPGTVTLPRSEADRIAAIEAAQNAGLIDPVDAIREFHGLSSDQEAIDYYAAYKERIAVAPKLNAEVKSISLPSRVTK